VQAARGQFPDEKTFTERLTKAGLTPEILSTRIRKQITLQVILRAKVPVPAEPKPEDVKKFYQENEARFNEAAKVKASHILVRVTDKNTAPEKAALKKKADDARSRVAKGEDFAKVASEVSDDVSNAKTGGDLGYFRKEEMVPEFSKVAFSSKVGTLSPVFETPYGYHFLKVTDTQAEKKHSFDEVQERLRGYLQDKGRGEVMKTYIEGLQKKAAVVYHFITVAAKPAEPSKP
jgi:parvulin-like peptidyl-prolyl isomerase